MSERCALSRRKPLCPVSCEHIGARFRNDAVPWTADAILYGQLCYMNSDARMLLNNEQRKKVENIEERATYLTSLDVQVNAFTV